MMIAWFIVVIYVLIGLGLLAGLIYVIVKRIQDRENEDFERRDN
tara:strand:+ start:62161 stop:62292 length:132 start_codon:yes stop_codon:yes gene_type:complete